MINDIDLVCLVAGEYNAFLNRYDALVTDQKLRGAKILRSTYNDMPLDLYIATDATYDTLVLIRTGSTQHNIKLTTTAKAKGWKLAASGLGLLNEGGEVIARTEHEIFEKLGLPYVEPEKRL